MGLRRTGVLATALLALGLVSPGSTAAAAEEPVIHFVVDISGSMSGTPLQQAKEALHEAAKDLSPDTQVGLRSYAGVCGDGGDLVVPIDDFDAATFDAAVDALAAGGGTPTPDALRAAAADLPASGDRTIVFISDGQSTCGDPCPVAADIKNTMGVDFRVHTVGFNAPTQAATELTCIANVTGGNYLEARDSQGLGDVLGSLITKPQRYVALGDSFVSGEGAGDGQFFQDPVTRYLCVRPKHAQVPGIPEQPVDRDKAIPGMDCTPYQTSRDTRCHRASSAYSFVLARNSRSIRDDVLNVACSGAETKHLLTEWFKGEQPQIQALRNANGKETVDLVTVGIGGNDIRFSGIIARCIGTSHCYNDGYYGWGALPDQKQLREKVTLPIKKVIREAHAAAPKANIAIVSYPQLLPESWDDMDTLSCAWIAQREHGILRNLVGNLNWAQWKAVDEMRAELGKDNVRVVFADITKALEGNEYCRENATSYVTGLVQQGPIHPTPAGHKRMAAEVKKELISEKLITG